MKREFINWKIYLKKLISIMKNKKNMPKTRQFHKLILLNIFIRINTYPSQTIPKNCRGGNTSELTLVDQHHPGTKTSQRHHKKRKLQANINNEI